MVIQVNSGVHAENIPDSTYLDYDVGDPPGAYQVRPSIAADLWIGPAADRDDVHWHRGFVYVGWDDNRRGGFDRDIYVARSNMTYFATTPSTGWTRTITCGARRAAYASSPQARTFRRSTMLASKGSPGTASSGTQ